jgi:hypothetical protein
VARTFRAERAQGRDFEASLATAAEPAVGALLSRLLAAEIGVLRSAASFGPRGDGFTHHEKVGWGLIAVIFAKMLLVETALTHVLVAHYVDDRLAWLVTALSLYALVWLLADYNRLRTEPTRVDGGVLRIRVGIRGSADVPLDAIASIGPPAADEMVDLSLFGGPDRVIRLNRPIDVVRRFGIRAPTRAIGLSLDDADAFASACGSP